VDSSRGLVYFDTGSVTAANDKLFSCNLTGGSLTTLTSGASFTASPGELGVDASQNMIYVCDRTQGGGGIFRFNSTGGSKTTIYANSVSGSQVLGVELLSLASTTLNSLTASTPRPRTSRR